MTDICMHNKVELDLRWKLVGTSCYFLMMTTYFFLTDRSGTIAGSFRSTGGISVGALEVTGALAVGIIVFGILPGKKICKNFGHSWRF